MNLKSVVNLLVLFIILSLAFALCNFVLNFVLPVSLRLQMQYPSVRPITDFTGYGEPRWSPDGTRIAFDGTSLGSGILIMNSNGTQMRSLNETAGHGVTPDWSPDSKRIIFASQQGVRWQIYVIDVDGGTVVQLTDFSSASCPRWSPDGRRIAFCNITNKKEESGIYVMDADGTNISRLVGYPLGNAMPHEWSPDSTKLVFTATNEATVKPGQTIPENLQEYGPHLYVINVDGSNLTRLNKGIAGVYHPTWSPDGTQILFSIGGIAMPGGFYMVDLDGSEGRRIFNEQSCEQPQWSRVTNRLLFVCSKGLHTAQLFTMDIQDLLK